jgi:hypothetical protein
MGRGDIPTRLRLRRVGVLHYVSTQSQLVDVLMKGLSNLVFENIISKLGIDTQLEGEC